MLNPRLEIFYEKIICEDFVVLYNFTNIALLPKLSKAVLSSTSNNYGSSEVSVAQSFCAWQLITSQKSAITRARKSIAFFNVRKEMILGLKTTLRKKTLFSCLDKVLTFVLPRSISERHNSRRFSNQNIITNQKFVKEKQSGLLLKPLYETKNKNKTVLFTEDKSKDLFLSLPYFLKKEQSFQKGSNLLALEQKIKKVNFLNKLCNNWDRQNDKNFFNNFCLDENFSQKSTEQYLDIKSSKKKVAFLLKKLSIKSNNNSLNKSFFTISNKSGSSFPEIISLSSFFDSLSGFSLTFSLKKLKLLQIFSLTREDLIKKQFFSAFGCPQ